MHLSVVSALWVVVFAGGLGARTRAASAPCSRRSWHRGGSTRRLCTTGMPVAARRAEGAGSRAVITCTAPPTQALTARRRGRGVLRHTKHGQRAQAPRCPSHSSLHDAHELRRTAAFLRCLCCPPTVLHCWPVCRMPHTQHPMQPPLAAAQAQATYSSHTYTTHAPLPPQLHMTSPLGLLLVVRKRRQSCVWR